VLPGVVFLSFGGEGIHPSATSKSWTDTTSHTHLLKVRSGFNMNKLSMANQLILDVLDGKCTVHQAHVELDGRIRRAPDYPRPISLIAYPMHAFALCILVFGGSFVDSTVSAFLGLVVGLLRWLADVAPSYAPLYEFTAAFAVSFLARGAQAVLQSAQGCTTYLTTVLSGIAMLLPGLSLTLAIMEITTRHLISGTVRLFHALFISLLLGLGMSMGSNLALFYNIQPNDCTSPRLPSPYWAILFFPQLALAGKSGGRGCSECRKCTEHRVLVVVVSLGL
jgi:uncharacterized membrane protein YjjP (DUF1212 family)